MSGYGWYSSGNGGPNGFSRAQPIHHSNSVQEECVICHLVFDSTEALINHYDSHMRDGNLSRAIREGNLPPAQAVGQNNYVRVQNQAASQAQRSLAFGHDQNQNLLPQAIPLARASHTIIQRRQIDPIVNYVARRQNFAPPNMVRPTGAPFAQPNQPIVVPDEIELDFDDEENSDTDDSISLDLNLGPN